MTNDLRRWMKLCDSDFYGFDDQEPEDTVVPLSYGRPALPDPSDHAELIKYYIYGGCQKFALVMSGLFGYPIAAAIIGDVDSDEDEDEMRSAQHVFCLTDPDTAVDIRGKKSVCEMLHEWRNRRVPRLLVFDENSKRSLRRERMFRPTERRLLTTYIIQNADRYR